VTSVSGSCVHPTRLVRNPTPGSLLISGSGGATKRGWRGGHVLDRRTIYVLLIAVARLTLVLARGGVGVVPGRKLGATEPPEPLGLVVVSDLKTLIGHQLVVHLVCRLTAGPELEVNERPHERDIILIRLLHKINGANTVATENTVKGVAVKIGVNALGVSTVDVDAGDIVARHVLLCDFL